MRKVTVITGDGASSRVVSSVVTFLQSAKVPLIYEIFTGTPDKHMLSEITNSVKTNKIALKGTWKTNLVDNSESWNVALRRNLDLWANVVHIKSHNFLNPTKSNVDFVVIRQNTEGEYSQIEHEVTPGYIEMFKITTQERCKQIAEFAFDYAWRNNRSKITCVHKANIMKMGDGLFLETCREVAKNNPNLAFNDLIVDNCAMQLIMRPESFDVVVAPNLYGNIISAIGSGIIGSSSMIAGCNYNTLIGIAMFESGGRSIEEHCCGEDKINPSGTLLAACKMLSHIGEFETALRLEQALYNTICNRNIKTPDIGASSTTEEVLSSVLDEYFKQ